MHEHPLNAFTGKKKPRGKTRSPEGKESPEGKKVPSKKIKPVGKLKSWPWQSACRGLRDMEGGGERGEDMEELLTLPALSMQEPFASEVLRGAKTVESRGTDILEPLAGQLLAIRRGKQRWDPKKNGQPCCDLQSGYTDGRIAGVVRIRSTSTKTDMVGSIGRDALTARVGLPYASVRRYCTCLSTPMRLPLPVPYDGYLGPHGWASLVWVSLSREQWGEQVWEAAHARRPE